MDGRLEPKPDGFEATEVAALWLAIRSDEGQDLAEYAILIGLLALVVVGAVTLFGGQLVALYGTITTTLPF